MTLEPRSVLRTPAALAALALLVITAVPAVAQAPVQGRRHPVGWERIVRSPLPQPVRAADGSVTVPLGFREFPTQENDFGVIDDPAVDVHDRGEAVPSRMTVAERAASVSANVRANNTAGDPAGTTNSETTISADGPNLAAGWNDGRNFSVSPGATGWGYSTNGGLTWTDGGVLPVPGPTALHEGDPVITNDGAGNFYFVDLYSPDNDVTSAIAVCKGTFSPNLSYGMPVMVASTIPDFLDKPWIAADKGTGNVYVTYTHFLAAGGNQIDFSRSTDGGATWSLPAVLTLTAIESVQGSRVAVGPSGEIQVIYFVFDKGTGNNYMRARRSTDFGLTFGPEVTLPTGPNGIFSGFGSGPPGYNRPRGIGFPGLTIDRTAGANSGRVYATWEETVNFYFDPLGALGAVAEVEANDTPATANLITIGQAVTGTMSSTADQDWFKFTGTAGSTVILYLVPGTGDGFLRLFAGGGAAANRTQLSYIAFGTGLCVYTLPYSGTFYIRVLANSATIGTYTVYTGPDLPDPGDEVARDTRDVIFQSSPDGVAWDARRVINDDAPLYDNTFPEVAVDGAGQVFVDWYDHRGDLLAINTDIYYTRSSNGGASWAGSIKVNDGPPVNWSLVSSNLAPNMGDYSALVSDGCNVYANFADGRQGTPDSWVATINDCATPTVISLVQAQAQPDHVDLGWYAADGASVSATVERRQEGGDWMALASIRTDGTSQLSYRDAAVTPGARYEYRIAVGAETFGSTGWIQIPSELALAVRSLSNPVKDALTVSFTLPHAEPATLELLDVTGRSVESARVTASGQMRLGSDLRAGVYVVRLSQRGQRVMTKAVVVR